MSVEGFAKRDGKPVGGAMIVLVPKDSEGDSDRFRRDESDLDGSFLLKDVVPGSYTVCPRLRYCATTAGSAHSRSHPFSIAMTV